MICFDYYLPLSVIGIEVVDLLTFFMSAVFVWL